MAEVALELADQLHEPALVLAPDWLDGDTQPVLTRADGR
jgi:hypothetical protein